MATNDVYINPGNSRQWSDTVGGAIDEQMDLGSLAADGVRCGSYSDLDVDFGGGAGTARPDEYEWELVIDGFATAPVANQTVDLYFTQSSDATQFDGELTTAPTDTVDASSDPSTNMLSNMLYAGSCVVISTTAGDELRARGVIRLTSRYVAPVIHNNTDDALLGTSDAHILTLTAIPYQVQ